MKMEWLTKHLKVVEYRLFYGFLGIGIILAGIVVLLVVFGAAAIKEISRPPTGNTVRIISTDLPSGQRIEELTIDGCQYLKTRTGDGFVLTHKGNCTNIIHQINKEIK